jgi:L,D-peptidoglycan transpeptidase YkuD (ErfK/YbiS/YcfS/YnhG family)
MLSTASCACHFLKVVPMPGNRQKGRIIVGLRSFPCALGRGGLGLKKREGDGITPAGVFALRRLHVRSDRVKLPRWAYLARRIARTDWWCDELADRAYNRLVTTRTMPRGSKEGLWRKDALYDLLIEIGYNDKPVVRGKGSGIIMHLARKGFTPTQGCVAVTREAFLKLLQVIGPETKIIIG